MTISSRSMPRAIRRVAAPTKRSRSPSRRIGMGPPGGSPCPVRRSLPEASASPPPGWAGMPSGEGRGRWASGSAAEGWECSEPAAAVSGSGFTGVPAGSFRLARDVLVPGAEGGSPVRACAGKPAPPDGLDGVEVCRSAPRGSAGSAPPGRSNEVGCSVTRVESVRPGPHAARADRPAEMPIPGIRAPGTEFPRGQRLFLCHRRTGGPNRWCPDTPRSRPAAPR